LCTSLMFCSHFLLSQNLSYDFNKQYSTTELKEDYQLMRKHLEIVHGGIYTYTDKTDFDQKFDQLFQQITKPMTELEFYGLVGQLSADIKDSHTSIEPSGKCVDYIDEVQPMLPLGFRWIEDHFYLSRNLSEDDDIKEGWELLEINGEAIGTVLNRLILYPERDGDNQTSPRRSLAGSFQDYYAMLVARPETHELVFKNNQNETIKKQVKSLSWPRQLEIWEERYGAFSNQPIPQLALTMKPNKTAILKVRSWHPGRIKNAGQNYKRFFKDAFDQIEKEQVEHLILDMRNNGGGSEVVFMRCLDHLLDQPYRVYKELSARSIKFPDKKMYPNDKIKALELYGKLKMQKKGDRYYVKKDPSLKLKKTKAPHYDGKLYVLINEFSHSATGDMSGVLMQYGRGVFIGNETGGNPYENVAGESPALHLPNTGLRVRIPVLKYKINIDQENTRQGAVPDHRVIPDIQDYISGNDKVLKYTLDLINQQN
ncbi:MAG: S41 family peptidase, partial [Bacteroidota bacterium]